MTIDLIDFKMTKEGLVLVIKDYDNLEDVVNQLTSKISQMSGFFAAGDKIMLMIENNEKHSHDMPRIISILKKMGIEVSQILMGVTAKEGINVRGRMKMVEEGETKSGTKVVKKNLRSGQALVHSGDVIVIGNVHSGAEIMAGGSIVVFGNVKGILRAGLNESDSIVAALSMEPSLIQISEYILREAGSYDEPVVVHVKQNKIVIESAKDVKFQ
ncbi:septum site-determining protein MinC [Pseudothermotoga lettingae TMO]|uniref:Probable septum site-determining protein MinC n=1 Tax=Pseudothermotoga lettingae (strain ATCC BAA-301 / DSM 14385 / NBRC 107922 / TMO) TaxID=416591 RepID=MINC_PSELT|nr:RecName: Full=Probable septum site-determining protein MinC [Pseudothermotoga lettingae TMO]KUK21390.1 MAG: putative septum site-determining protein MinC [Pseudothermotoga lettingae]MDI3494839.1 septum site-determining protein MinC [Pseudothermotoga sp.]ABV34034.1 septum site-determining protein MinC [Pseudothermotoga lettingae TMO]MDK2884659.1 septum site-determining protein MinC [Pseudothermotoga sp.]GLI49027.1 putative septum site-determining protein MinC [Pseudothermotoga lettingae TMO]